MVYFPAMTRVMAGRIAAAAALLAALAVAMLMPSVAAASAPAGPSLSLYEPDAFALGGHLVSVPGRAVHVHGVVRPYVAGQAVEVTATVNGKSFETETLRIRPTKSGPNGQFTAVISAPRAGLVVVHVTHAATPTQGAFANHRDYDALDEHVSFGARGPFVDLIQERLAALHFYIPRTGVYDTGTGLALDAYHRLLRAGESQTLDARTVSDLLDGRGAFPVHFPHNGQHAEGDLSLQLLALVDGSKVVEIYPISSGKPSTPTILGNFRVYSKVPGYLPDGMYFSNFFIRGYAIHGYNPAPDYPASHGCMRLPIVDAISVFNWIKIGDWVDTYY
jgi:L,D-transpeptidase catalytic domain